MDTKHMKRQQVEWTIPEYMHFFLQVANMQLSKNFQTVREFAEAMKAEYEQVGRMQMANGNVMYIFYTEEIV